LVLDSSPAEFSSLALCPPIITLKFLRRTHSRRGEFPLPSPNDVHRCRALRPRATAPRP
jgi:hypothetical protein